ncbi:MAG: helix-turn-helix domain-containing protein [Cryomorphaceae bacterium]|nr:helix-turn-helix domain-containing protein [Cryomorphaceae bacterium]
MSGQALDNALSIRQDTSADKYDKPEALQKAEKKQKKKKQKKEVGATYKETLTMALEGMSIEAIANKRELAASTIEGHFRRLIGQGDLPMETLVNEELYQQISKALDGLPEDAGAKDVKAILGDACSFAQVFVVMDHLKQLESSTSNANGI